MLIQPLLALRSVVILAVATAGGLVAAERQAVPGLRIVVIQGEDAINVIQQKTAVAPIVEIRDRNDLPVAGATVSFTIGSKTATFAGGSQMMTISTNAGGRAVAAAVTPVSSGTVPIQISAVFQGQTATAAITQTNVMTVAQAAGAAAGSAAAPAGAGGGGLSGQTLVIIGAAGAAGAGAIVATSGGADTPLQVNTVTADPSVALQGGTAVRFTSQIGDSGRSLTHAWQFGDGSSSSEPAPTHVYGTAGTFNVTLTISDDQSTATGTTSLTVRSITGTWQRTTAIRPTTGLAWTTITLTQSGTSLAGTINLFAVNRPPGSQDNICPVTGVVRVATSPAEISRPACAVLNTSGTTQVIPSETFNLNLAPDFNSFTAVVLGEPESFTWVRQ